MRRNLYTLSIFLILTLPSVGILLPGAFTGWVKLIPSYYLVEAVHQTANLGAGWVAMWPYLLALAATGVASLALGAAVLSRQLR